MEQQGLRDVDRWKDKIEVRLDNRQVAFLFFGSALVACLLFILGVIVGKRLESRGRALAPEIEDPLALLDRVAATAPTAEPPPVESQPDPIPARPAVVKKPIEKISEKPAEKPMEPPAEKRAEPTAERPVAAPEPRPLEKSAAKTVESPPERPADKPAAKSPDILPPSFEAPAAGKKPRFMLQVGSFPDRAEAEAYASTLAAERPQVIMSEIPGKGTWYRVRLGSFQAFKDAVDAKMVFEKRYNKIALVVGPL